VGGAGTLGGTGGRAGRSAALVQVQVELLRGGGVGVAIPVFLRPQFFYIESLDLLLCINVNKICIHLQKVRMYFVRHTLIHKQAA
jgi:hypothetical protein